MSSSIGLDVACHVNIFTTDLSPATLPRTLDEIAAAGFRRVVLPPMLPDADYTRELAKTLAAADIRPIAMINQMPEANVASEDPVVAEAGSVRLQQAITFAEAVGADQLNGVPYGLFGRPTEPVSRLAVHQAARAVGKAADLAKASGITMTFEVLNRYETSMINTAQQALEFVASSESENLMIHLDTFHMAIEEADMLGAIQSVLPRLGYLELGQSGRGLLSTGAVPIAQTIRKVLDLGYTGRWGLEAFSRPILDTGSADMLSIWQEQYSNGNEFLRDATSEIESAVLAGANSN